MIKLTIFIVLSVSTPFSFGKSQMEMRGALEEQSFFLEDIIKRMSMVMAKVLI